jgi:TetR/AcrR family transcriptional repressor of nem operon
MSKAQRTKVFIIEKTAPIFNTKGFAGTSLADIEIATGLSKGSIYGNFANKDEVALAVFDYNLKKVNTAFSIELSKFDSAKDKLMVYAEKYHFMFNTKLINGGCPVLNTATEADDTHPALRNRAAKAILSWKNKIVSIIEEGKKHNEFLCHVDAEQTALTMIAMMEGGIMIAKVMGDISYMSTIMQSMKKLIEDL